MTVDRKTLMLAFLVSALNAIGALLSIVGRGPHIASACFGFALVLSLLNVWRLYRITRLPKRWPRAIVTYRGDRR